MAGRRPASSRCLSDDELVAIASSDDELVAIASSDDEAGRRRVHEHMDGCDECRAIVADLLRSHQQSPEPVDGSVREG
jgi:hypothetical protein